MTPRSVPAGAPGTSNELLADRYEVGPAVARGGMGAVHQARDVRLGRTVAVKRLRVDLASDPVARQRFEHEGRAAARIDHPNVVTVLDVGTDDAGEPFLVLEWLPGPTLAQALAGGPFEPDRVRAIALQILAALAAAHERGVLHRDVKPSNIILGPAGEAKLADFGIAKTVDGLDLTTVGDVIGTIRYLAPERLAGQPASASSDLYSLGVVLHEAATGATPFGSTPMTPAELSYAVSHVGLPALSEQTLGPLATVVNRAIQREPERRYASAGEMAAALAEEPAVTTQLAVGATEVYPTAVAPTAAMPTVAGRRRGRVVLSLLLAALVVVAALVLAARANDTTPPATVPPATTAPAAPTTEGVPTTTVAPTTVPTTSPPTTAPAPDAGGKGPGKGKGAKGKG